MSASRSRLSSPKRLAQAKDAAELIDIDYEALPSVTDTADAADGKIAVWPDCPDNISNLFEAGNKAAADAAFANAAHIVKRRYVISRVYAHFMEPRGAIGVWDPGEERFTLYADVQYPHRVRQALATRIFKIPESKHPGHRRRCRRRVRHQGLAVSRAPAGAARGEETAPAGQMDLRAQRRRSRPTSTPATMSATPSWRSTRTASFSACGSRPSPMSAPTSRPSAICSRPSAMSGRWSAPTTSRRPMSASTR